MDSDQFTDEEGVCRMPCPNCGSPVEVVSSRDGRVLSTYAQCQGPEHVCGGQFFTTESHENPNWLDHLSQSDFDTVAIKFDQWAHTSKASEGYRRDEEWT